MAQKTSNSDWCCWCLGEVRDGCHGTDFDCPVHSRHLAKISRWKQQSNDRCVLELAQHHRLVSINMYTSRRCHYSSEQFLDPNVDNDMHIKIFCSIQVLAYRISQYIAPEDFSVGDVIYILRRRDVNGHIVDWIVLDDELYVTDAQRQLFPGADINFYEALQRRLHTKSIQYEPKFPLSHMLRHFAIPVCKVSSPNCSPVRVNFCCCYKKCNEQNSPAFAYFVKTKTQS